MVVTNAQFIKPLIVPMVLSVLFYLGALRYQLKPEVIKGNILQNELEWRFIKDEALRFEIKKISSAMPLLISITTVAVIVSLVFIQVSVNDQQRISYFLGESGHVQLFEEEIANQEAKIEQMREVMNDPDLSEEQREETFILLEHEKQSLIGLKTSLREYTSLKSLYEEKNYERFYRIAQNQVKSAFGMDANVENPEAIVFNEYVEGRPSNFAYEVSLEYNNQLKERQISPVLGTQRIDTVYDEYVSQQAKNEAAIYNTPAIMSGLNSWHRFSMVYYFDFILIALSVFFFGSGFVLEKESGNHHGLMLTQPQTKSKLTRNKILATLIVSGLFIGTLIVFLFIIGLLRGRFGSWNYLVLEYLGIVSDPLNATSTLGVDFGFMNLITYWIKSLPLMILGLIFAMSFANFVSLFIRNRLVHLSVVIAILAIGLLMATQGLLGNLTAFLPTSYLHAGMVVDGSLMVVSGSSLVSYGVGLIVLALGSILFVFLSIKISEARELL